MGRIHGTAAEQYIIRGDEKQAGKRAASDRWKIRGKTGLLTVLVSACRKLVLRNFIRLAISSRKMRVKK